MSILTKRSSPYTCHIRFLYTSTMTVPVLQHTVWIFDLDTVGSQRWFAHSGLVFSKHSELVSAVLDKVGNIDHVCQAGRQVDAVPVLCAVLPLVHPV